jgi:hypothetical protein
MVSRLLLLSRLPSQLASTTFPATDARDPTNDDNKENNFATQPAPSTHHVSSIMQLPKTIIENPPTQLQRDGIKIILSIYAPEYKRGEVGAGYDDVELEVSGERSDEMGNSYEFFHIFQFSSIIDVSKFNMDKCKMKGSLRNGYHIIIVDFAEDQV